MLSSQQANIEPRRIATLSLAKYSHTTTGIHHSDPSNWVHILGNGEIWAVFQRYVEHPAAHTWLKIFQNQNVLVWYPNLTRLIPCPCGLLLGKY